MGYTTRIDKALRLTQSQMFSIANGGRPGVSKVVVLLTDGSQTQDAGAENPAVVAEELRSQGYKVLAVGIGGGVNSTELAHITGAQSNVFSAATFDELISQEFLDKLNQAGCKEAKREVKPSCDVKVDVGFVLDSSGSLKDDYGKEKSFLKALAATFGVSEQGARAGVVTFSFDAEHSVKLNDHYDLASFNDAVDNIPLMGYTTRIDKALRLTQSQMFSIANGGRPGVSKVVVLLTDGSQTQDAGAENPAVVAEELRSQGYKVLAVGIGDGIKAVELQGIAGSIDNIYISSSFDELIQPQFLKTVTDASCKLANLIITTTSTTTSTTTTTTPKPQTTPCITPAPKCPGIDKCSACCQPQQTYINIFQAGSGPTYLMQGMRLPSNTSENQGFSKGLVFPKMEPTLNLKSLSNDDLLSTIEKRLNGQSALLQSIKKALASANNIVTKRARRSLNKDPFEEILPIVVASGCHLFIQQLKQNNLWKQVMNSMTTHHKPLTLFCPQDISMEKSQLAPDVLLHHLTKKFGRNGMMFKSLMDGSKMMLHAAQPKSAKANAEFKIEDANIKICLSQGVINICIIDKVLQPITSTVKGILENNKNLSVMNELVRKSPLQKLLHRNRFVNRVCFTDKICLPIVGKLRKLFNDLLKAKQYTIQLVENNFFGKMNPLQFLALKTNRKLRDEFLLQHIFLGILQHNDQDNNSRLIATSAQQRQPVSEWLWSDGKPIVVKSGNSVFVIDRQIRVKEGLVQVLRRLE
ncbi:uncharacterized protein [Clytia hemisphaerica]|uniref:uncharacterized protein isoform X2 n=1 Tax=Clytia hemisphaerica TaxID=252671 RepID=UPI0034D4CCB1